MSAVLKRTPTPVRRRVAGMPSVSSGVAFGVALSVLSALLATWAFPPYGYWPLIFVATGADGGGPALASSRDGSPGLGPGIGIGGFYAGYLHGLDRPDFALVGLGHAAIAIALDVAVGAADRWRFREQRLCTHRLDVPAL